MLTHEELLKVLKLEHRVSKLDGGKASLALLVPPDVFYRYSAVAFGRERIILPDDPDAKDIDFIPSPVPHQDEAELTQAIVEDLALAHWLGPKLDGDGGCKQCEASVIQIESYVPEQTVPSVAPQP
jgi:hypothetical protein